MGIDYKVALASLGRVRRIPDGGEAPHIIIPRGLGSAGAPPLVELISPATSPTGSALWTRKITPIHPNDEALFKKLAAEGNGATAMIRRNIEAGYRVGRGLWVRPVEDGELLVRRLSGSSITVRPGDTRVEPFYLQGADYVALNREPFFTFHDPSPVVFRGHHRYPGELHFVLRGAIQSAMEQAGNAFRVRCPDNPSLGTEISLGIRYTKALGLELLPADQPLLVISHEGQKRTEIAAGQAPSGVYLRAGDIFQVGLQRPVIFREAQGERALVTFRGEHNHLSLPPREIARAYRVAGQWTALHRGDHQVQVLFEPVSNRFLFRTTYPTSAEGLFLQGESITRFSRDLTLVAVDLLSASGQPIHTIVQMGESEPFLLSPSIVIAAVRAAEGLGGHPIDEPWLPHELPDLLAWACRALELRFENVDDPNLLRAAYRRQLMDDAELATAAYQTLLQVHGFQAPTPHNIS